MLCKYDSRHYFYNMKFRSFCILGRHNITSDILCNLYNIIYYNLLFESTRIYCSSNLINLKKIYVQNRMIRYCRRLHIRRKYERNNNNYYNKDYKDHNFK